MLYSVAGIVILLIVVGSVTVIYNAFAISVSERKKQFGMLASTGPPPARSGTPCFSKGPSWADRHTAGASFRHRGHRVTLAVVNRLLLESIYNQDIALRLVVSPVTVWARSPSWG